MSSDVVAGKRYIRNEGLGRTTLPGCWATRTRGMLVKHRGQTLAFVSQHSVSRSITSVPEKTNALTGPNAAMRTARQTWRIVNNVHNHQVSESQLTSHS